MFNKVHCLSADRFELRPLRDQPILQVAPQRRTYVFRGHRRTRSSYGHQSKILPKVFAPSADQRILNASL